MFGLLKRNSPSVGSVFFPGTIPPRAEEFRYLKIHGVELSRYPDSPEAHWKLKLRHPKWGKADVVCLRDMEMFPRTMLEWSPDLSEEETQRAALARTGITIIVDGARHNALADRKRLLWYMSMMMGDDGVVALDHVSGRFWPRSNLDDEMMHDADVDVEALYCIHAVVPDDAPPPPRPSRRRGPGGSDQDDDEADGWDITWLHTHGLGEMGALDFDILNPSPDLGRDAGEAIRALAFAIMEGSAKPGATIALGQPGGDIRLVPVGEFHRSAAAEHTVLRENDENHNRDRVVVCDPAKGLLRRLSGKPRPSGFFSGPIGEGTVFHFSAAATDVMATRARQTFALLKDMATEFAEFQCPALVKLGIPTDNAAAEGTDSREHIWFEVHGFEREAIDATCLNQPYDVSSLAEGDRGLHSPDRLTDWSIMTPVGPITPRSMGAARVIRQNQDKLRELMERLRAEDAASA